ncbi:THUMP domain-containing protein [Geoglobus acetivorans]|uniref:THUMP domain-containing protein n=1 Tax=Geoglobus acetivorans TaxID=565033 RepID=A0ABZ3H3D1_GEOAI|nr:hypothetical protein [Geoglobus acetivorans]
MFFRSDCEKIPLMHCMLRTAEWIVLLLERDEAENLEDIYRIVRGVDFSFIRPDWSSAVRATRAGDHDFTSIDIGRAAGKAVIDSYKEKRCTKLRVNLNEPNVIVQCDLTGTDYMVGMDMTGTEDSTKGVTGHTIIQHRSTRL